MKALDVVLTWQESESDHIDLLLLGECEDTHRVIPSQIGEQFWIFVQSYTSLKEHQKHTKETVFNIGTTKIQVQPIEAWRQSSIG
ncbi:hypothetical protein F7U66_01995 [Vibrio parahaemolyticus]|nr:hypothetical protein [Vibrio parahaemolyticus]